MALLQLAIADEKSKMMNDNPIPGLAALKPVAPKGPTCADCRFMIVDDKQFVCRRNPPQATVVMVPRPMPPQMIGGKVQQQMGMAPQTLSAWPLVMRDWWCGAYEAAFSAPKRDDGRAFAAANQHVVYRTGTLTGEAQEHADALLKMSFQDISGTELGRNLDARVPGDDPT